MANSCIISQKHWTEGKTIKTQDSKSHTCQTFFFSFWQWAVKSYHCADPKKTKKAVGTIKKTTEIQYHFFSSIMMGEHFESESGLTVIHSRSLNGIKKKAAYSADPWYSNESNSSQFRSHDIVTNLSLMPALQEQSVSGLNFFEVAVSGENDLQELMFA